MTKTPRQQLAAWMREAITGQAEIEMPALVDRAVAHFSGDVDFLRDWADDTLRPVAYTLGTQIAAETRIPSVLHEPVPTGQDSPPPRTPWLDRLEHVGSRYMRLRSMQKHDLLRWVEERRQRGTIELHLAGLGEKLATKMPDGKTVGEVYTEEEIDRWARLLKVSIKVAIPVPSNVKPRKEQAA